MRKFIVVLSLAGLALASGCREKETSPSTAGSPSADILARYHFIGTSHLAGDTNAARLREISVLSETRKFEDQTLKKLAHAPKVFYGDKISAEQDERGAALIRPLLDDLLRQESFVQARGPANKRAEWALLVELPPDRLKAWGAAVGELTQVWKLGNPTTSSVEGFSVSEVRRSDEPTLIRWAEAGQWFVLGVGQDSLPTGSKQN